MNTDIRTYLDTVQASISFVNAAQIEAATDLLFNAFMQRRSIFTMGNGASAALAAHIACDLGKGTATDIGLGLESPAKRRMRITSLVDNVALMTAYGNDVCYEDVFIEQLKGLLDPGDVVLAISGSGSSPNVMRALEYAHAHGARTIGMTGNRQSAEPFAALCDVCIQAPLTMMEQIEDLHVIFSHAIAIALRARIAEHNTLAGIPVTRATVPAAVDIPAGS